MKIDISDIKRGNVKSKSFHISQAFLLLSDIEYSDIQIGGEVIDNHTALEVTGEIAVAAKYVCGRCLEPFTVSIHLSFHESFRELGSVSGVDDAERFSYQGDSIDVSGLVQTELVLNEPITRICSSECRGLCPVCGVNLNQQTCECKTDSVNPQFAALQQLLDKKKS
ncbi:YceD family protein [Acetonema longum]|uniref:DUF177 domain-containing protein n=1 Tax=Acetonema longum DSM 6540 TaxID=1009370 RepID=F7NFM2_9FIRM|nr:DUF177 domain-containing protein [Acetonema longum]EGO65145.1 hypothetical protein ALO_04256 [Acetonema longum DSM 6540]